MSEGAPIVPGAGAGPGGPSGAAIRPAGPADAPGAAAAVGELLDELGGERPAAGELEAAARELAGDPDLGALLVAEAGGEIVGVLAASWQHAIHVPGRYGTVQDLWVRPDWRGRRVGEELIERLARDAAEGGSARLEVGLPKEGFPALEATARFYGRVGFESLGPRMRRLLP